MDKVEGDIKSTVTSSLSLAYKGGATLKVKKLRKETFLSLQIDDDEKANKKAFKKVMKSFEEEGTISVDSDGIITVTKEIGKKEKKEKKKKKKKRENSEGNIGEDKEDGAKKQKTGEPEDENSSDNDGLEDYGNNVANPSNPQKNAPCPGNRDGVTRLFVGNLPFTVTEASLQAHLPGNMTHVKWITDKESGRFYGSAFIEMEDSVMARDCVKIAGSELEGRKLKINFAPSREGDVWPPKHSESTGGKQTTGESAGGKGKKAMSEKPADCKKLFIGNLSYDIDEDALYKFFDNVGSEVKAVRWLSHKDTGDFKGVGFVEFWNTEACDKAATLNGKNLLGRPIRIDWTE